MATASRTTKSFSLDKEVLQEVERTKGPVSMSERVNELLKIGLGIERSKSLHKEAAAFFAGDTEERTSRRALQRASMKAITRN